MHDARRLISDDAIHRSNAARHSAFHIPTPLHDISSHTLKRLQRGWRQQSTASAETQTVPDVSSNDSAKTLLAKGSTPGPQLGSVEVPTEPVEDGSANNSTKTLLEKGSTPGQQLGSVEVPSEPVDEEDTNNPTKTLLEKGSTSGPQLESAEVPSKPVAERGPDGPTVPDGSQAEGPELFHLCGGDPYLEEPCHTSDLGLWAANEVNRRTTPT